MKLRCTSCDLVFDPEAEPRCPQCLKTSTVEPAQRAKEKSTSTPPSLFRGPGLLLTFAIIIPVMVLVRPRPIWLTFLVALVGFGAGHAVNHWWARR